MRLKTTQAKLGSSSFVWESQNTPPPQEAHYLITSFWLPLRRFPVCLASLSEVLQPLALLPRLLSRSTCKQCRVHASIASREELRCVCLCALVLPENLKAYEWHILALQQATLPHRVSSLKRCRANEPQSHFKHARTSEQVCILL